MVVKLGALTWKDHKGLEEIDGEMVTVMRRSYYISGVDMTSEIQTMIDKRIIVEPRIQALLDDWDD